MKLTYKILIFSVLLTVCWDTILKFKRKKKASESLLHQTMIIKLLLINFINSVMCNDILNQDLQLMNSELLEFSKITAHLEWKSSTEPTVAVLNLKKDFSAVKTKWRLNWCGKFKNNRRLREMRAVHYLCRGPKYSSREAQYLSIIADKLLINYEVTEVCNRSEECFCGEPDLKRLMASSRNESILRWAWTSWRNRMSLLKPLFMEAVVLENSGARRNGYSDAGDIWREEEGVEDAERMMEVLWREVKELYRLLHAIMRFRLWELYPETVDPFGNIPAHLLGDLWAQNWDSLIDLFLPKESLIMNITESLKKKNYSVTNMVERAEDFYVSLGFPRLPDKFWENSVFLNNNRVNCHAAAFNMYEPNDFRILGCFDVNEEDFHVIHHEIGHIYYYMAYQNQDPIFRNGVNPAFHESIGEAVLLGVMTPQHLQRLGLADDAILTEDFSISLKQALMKIPQIAYAMIMEKWRWRVFEGNLEIRRLNEYWWKLHEDFMGIVPPEPRPDEFFFDSTAKFHVVANVPYSRYFFGSFLQFQIFDSLCQSAVTGKFSLNFTLPLHKCDIYGSKDSSKQLRNLMEMGSTIDLPEALKKLIKSPKLRAEPLLRYFKPVNDFLIKEINNLNIPVGWN